MLTTQRVQVVSIPLRQPDPDGFQERLRDFLLAFVPLRIWELRDADEAEIGRLQREATELITSHGDDLQFGGRNRAEARVAMITALAILARAEGGANVFGVHACIAPHVGCPGSAGREFDRESA